MKTLFGYVVVGLLLGLVPFGLIALARSQPSSQPPIHPIQDMFYQQKFRPQRSNPMFADGRAMRPRLPGVTAVSDLQVDNEMVNDPDSPHMIGKNADPLKFDEESTYQRVVEGAEWIPSPSGRGAGGEGGSQSGAARSSGAVASALRPNPLPAGEGDRRYVQQIPLKLSLEGARDLLRRGRERYTIHCAVCHGQGGYGDGLVAIDADKIREAGGDVTTWVAPKNLHADDVRQQSAGKIYNTINNGIRQMPAYGKQISVLDRWAIVAYVKALQRSQGDVPQAEKDRSK